MGISLSNKEGKYSKTKLGGLLVGISAVVGTLGLWFQGNLESLTAVQQLITEVGAVLAWFGIRDIPFFNQKK